MVQHKFGSVWSTHRFLRKVRVLQDHGLGLAQTVCGALGAFYPHLNRSLCSSALLRSLNKWHLFNSILKVCDSEEKRRQEVK